MDFVAKNSLSASMVLYTVLAFVDRYELHRQDNLPKRTKQRGEVHTTVTVQS